MNKAPSQLQILENQRYTMKRLVYVNSSKHAYSEIPIDKHLAIFGNNNEGKTATLAGCKLLLYPEVNFSACAKKFMFEGEEGYFTKDQSYAFYFPSEKSFIALEVENPHGTFCMVLYRRPNYGYGRVFIPCAYSELRAFFWNSEADDFAEGFSVEKLVSLTSSRGGKHLTEADEIASLMFSSYRDARSRARFCVIPLKDGSKESINAFRDIFQLAFSSPNFEREVLPNAIATLLEMGRGRNEERLDANLKELTDEHQRLYLERQKLQQLENEQAKHAEAKADRERLHITLDNYSALYSSARTFLNEVAPGITAELAKHEAALSAVTTQIEGKSKARGLLVSSQEKARTTLSIHADNKAITESNITKGKSILGDSGHATISSYANWAEGVEKELNEEIAALSSIESAKLERDKKLKIKADLQAEIDRLSLVLKNNESLTLSQLDIHSASVLQSLRGEFQQLTAPVDDDAKAAITGFTKLFSEGDAGTLRFMNEDLLKGALRAYQPLSAEDIASKIKEKENSLRMTDNRLVALHNAIQEGENKKMQSQIEAELAALAEKKVLVLSLGANEKLLQELSSKITKINDELTEVSINIEGVQNELSVLRMEEKSQHDKIKSLASQIDCINTTERAIEQASRQANEAPLAAETTKKWEASDCEQLSASAFEFAKARQKLQISVQRIIDSIPHPDIDPHKELLNTTEILKVLEAYDSRFATLTYEKANLENAIKSHNQLVNSQLNELKDAETSLRSFVSNINKELNEYRISNLSKVELEIHLNPSFLSLLDSLKKIDISDNSLAEDGFYRALSEFTERFFNKATRRLKMNDIIERISYRYTEETTGKSDQKSQSKGTRSTTTAFILTVLIRKLIQKSITLQLPVIVDEISTIDISNTKATLAHAADNGLSVFCATPTFSAEVSYLAGRYILLRNAVVKKPMVENCHTNICEENLETFDVAA